jgi:uncharacterized protein (DUF1800 family)
VPGFFHFLAANDAWRPWVPTNQQPFDRRLAAHLYRRAGFAASSTQLDEAVKLGPVESAQQLLSRGNEVAAFDVEMKKFGELTLAANNPELLTAWWLHRMQHTPAPLLEKMTLFWHGHFATSAAKVRDAKLMYRQNDLLRRHALGDFHELVRGIARDPAMLLYLDSATNRKNHPNENFAREVMELFCLGVDRYTEKDIQELARCFTGWEIASGEFRFNEYQHDYGTKKLFGKSGQFDGDEGLKIILERPATAEFICEKLVRFFVADEPDLPTEMIKALAEQFRDGGLAIAPLMQTILTSRMFYSEASIGCKIRSPVELGIGLLKSLEANTNLVQLSGRLRDLGQMPLFPPNVKGWNGGRSWIDSSSLLGRANLVRAMVENSETRFDGVQVDEYLDRFSLNSSEQIVDWLSGLLVAVPLPPDIRGQLIDRLNEGGKRPASLKRLLHLLGSLPEFQLS